MFKAMQLLLIAVFFMLGATVFVYSGWSGLRAYQSEAWPQVQGAVLHADCRIAGNRTSARLVTYQYTVADTRYESERERFGLRIASNECTAGYTEGQPVRVYYDPANPADSVLLPGSYRQPVFGAAIGLAFMAFAALVLWFSRRKPARGN